MGVDTKLYVSKEWSVQDVRDVLKKRLGIVSTVEFHEWAPEYIVLNFGVPDSGNQRSLHVFTNSQIAGFPAMQLNFASNPEGCTILRMLANTFGGMFQEADTDDIFQEYGKPGEGNIDFIVREAIKSNPLLGQGGKEMAEYIVEEKWLNKEKV